MSAKSKGFTPSARRRVWVLVAALAGIATAVTAIGAHKSPTGAAAGDSLTGTIASTSPVARTLRLGTFNVDGCRGVDNKYDPQRTARCIAGCDLVALNELHGKSLGVPQNQAQILGQSLGQQWLFAPVERQWGHDAFGNGVVTHLPVAHWERFPLAMGNSAANRNVLILDVAAGDQTVHVLVTHLDRHETSAELHGVLSLFQSLATPAVLMGDLNTTPDDPEIQRVVSSGAVIDALGPSVGASKPHHIDWILLRGMKCLGAGVKDEGVSDHPFYWADVELNEHVAVVGK